MRLRASSYFVLTVMFTFGARPAHAIDWPVSTVPVTPPDPVEALRWSHVPMWIDQSPDRVRTALAALSADDPRTLARRAIALRALNREDDARTALAQAVAALPAVMDDPDVALTGAYLAARTHDYATAVRLARSALPLVEHGEMLAVEIARWSMARGPEGIDTAVEILRNWLNFGITREFVPGPLVRATLALALARSPRPMDVAEAVAIAHALRAQTSPLDPHAGDREPLLGGATVLGEGRAAVGVCMLLAGDPDSARAAVAVLEPTITSVPTPWRVFQSTMLANARRRVLQVTR